MCLLKVRDEDDAVATRVVKTVSPPPALPVVPVVAAPPTSVVDVGSVASFSSDEEYDRRVRHGNGAVYPTSVVSVHQDVLPHGGSRKKVTRQVETETRSYGRSAKSAGSSRHGILDDDRGSAYGGSRYGREGSLKGGYRYVSPSRDGRSEYGDMRRSHSPRRIDYPGYNDPRRRSSVSYVNPRESTKSVRSASGGRVSREKVVMVDRY